MSDKNRIPPELKRLDLYLPKDKHQRETLLRFLEQLRFDNAALLLLKGHLVIEEKITTIITKFVFHPEHLELARLTFAQKLAIARSMSLDEDKNGVWKVVEKVNSVRNALAHSLEGERRQKATAALRAVYSHECDGITKIERRDEAALISGAVTFCLGFLDTFEQEVERFKELVATLDKMINEPHRKHGQPIRKRK